jgi:hypothetical protein
LKAENEAAIKRGAPRGAAGGDPMVTGVLVIVAAGVCALVASRFMWWATSRSPMWAMAAGVLLLFAILAGAIIIAWLFTAAEYGP